MTTAVIDAGETAPDAAGDMDPITDAAPPDGQPDATLGRFETAERCWM